MAAQGYSAFSADAVTFIAKKTLMIALKQVIMYNIGDKAKLDSGNSKTFQYTRYDRLALPLYAMTDGVTPEQTNMSISTVQATAEQWGAYVNLSDVAVLTISHPVLSKAIDGLSICRDDRPRDYLGSSGRHRSVVPGHHYQAFELVEHLDRRYDHRPYP